MMKMNDMHAAILAPCSPEASCGTDLSFSPEFDRIQEARREDDPSIDYGEWQTELKQADWPTVVACCSELLATRSKDIRLAAWLTEGLIKTHGLCGLKDGLGILAQLLEQFGNEIHPQAVDDDQEQRIGNLSWLVARASALVREVPLTDGAGGAYNLNDYEAAQQLQAQLLRNPDAVTDLESKTTLEKIVAAARKTSKERYIQWSEDAEACLSLLQRLAAAADSLFGVDGPSFSSLRTSLEAVHMRLKTIAQETGIVVASAKPAEKVSTNQVQTEAALPGIELPATSGDIRNREQALAMLRQVADFFHNTEPHSPVAYLADKAAQWGTMPLHAWLRNVVKDRGTLANLEEMLGMESENPDS